MNCNFESWKAKKCYMYIFINRIYDSNNVLLADEIKVEYNSQSMFNYAMNNANMIYEIGMHSKGGIYQIPFAFVDEYKTEAAVYDNYEKIMSVLKPMYQFKHDGQQRQII